MKILLILPAAASLRVTATRPRAPRRAMLRFSVLALEMVAAVTPPGHEIYLCDENVEPLDLQADVDLVGISFMTAYAPRAYEIAAAFRRRGIVAVAGGYHPTFCPDEAAQHFDAVVVGEAETNWPQVLEDFQQGRLQRIYRAAPMGDLARLPLPRRDLIAHAQRHYVTTHAVQAGRGCVHGCRYCSITAFHQHTYRVRPVAHVLEELRHVPRNLMFIDDNIIADQDYARALFRAMTPLRKRWVSQCSLKIADTPALLAAARTAGCHGMFVGLETLDSTNLAAVDKQCNRVAEYAQRIRTIRTHGIAVIAGVIVGLDNDDAGVFQRTLRFLQRARIDAVQVNILTPLPGTPLYADYLCAGRIIDADWSHYNFRHCVIQPARMRAAELQAGADWLIRQFYRLDRILLRVARTWMTCGGTSAGLALKLNLTYRRDVRQFKMVGADPAAPRAAWHFRPRYWYAFFRNKMLYKHAGVAC